MIELENGDLLRAEVEALVNPVNCVGVMGKGLALQFKNAFPTASRAYARACRSGDLSPGHMHVFELGGPRPRFIIHFPTKRHWRDHARLEDIERGLQALVTEVHTREIRSIAVPALGCGLGGLPWSQVRPLMERALGALDETRVLVFGPQ